ncbi:MAG: tetratricopeptide repeat protein [Planctomycetes bacterium]|nr:tetratricopeptide repeat protein [Planctomycetota bacterium]
MSTFPGQDQVQEQALVAMRALDVEGALALVRRARRIDPRLVDLDGLEEALVWLLPRLAGGAADLALADALQAVVAEGLAGRLGSVAAMFVDSAIARHLCQRQRPSGSFIDDACRVPAALVDLILGSAAVARMSLADAIRDGRGNRADLWGYLGDACHIEQRHVEAEGCYARALLLDPDAVDAWRLRDRRLGACLGDLEGRHGADARGLWFAAAWIDGILDIPVGNNWLTPNQIAIRQDGTGSTTAAACRRFSLLLYFDRSARPGTTDMSRREEMAELLPEWFARFMAACRGRERGTDKGRPRLGSAWSH